MNAVYAQLVMDVGADKVVSAANRMGITSTLEPYPSIALGGLTIGVSPLEMASAYGTLAAQGIAHHPYGVVRVLGSDKELFRNSSKPVRALETEVANKTTAVLERVVMNGTGKRAQGLGRPAAGKTGTTDDYRDSWFAGFTPQLSTVVWIGYPEGADPAPQHPRPAARLRRKPSGGDLDSVHARRAGGKAGYRFPKDLTGRRPE